MAGAGQRVHFKRCRVSASLVFARRRLSGRADLGRLVFDEMTPLYHRLTTSIFYNDSTLLDNGIIITAADAAAAARAPQKPAERLPRGVRTSRTQHVT